MRACFRRSDLTILGACAARTSAPRRIRAARPAAPRSCGTPRPRPGSRARPAAGRRGAPSPGRRRPRGTRSGAPGRAGRGARRTTSATARACSRTPSRHRPPGTACRPPASRRRCAGRPRADPAAASGTPTRRARIRARSAPRGPARQIDLVHMIHSLNEARREDDAAAPRRSVVGRLPQRLIVGRSFSSSSSSELESARRSRDIRPSLVVASRTLAAQARRPAGRLVVPPADWSLG